jgi:hypothetical protein
MVTVVRTSTPTYFEHFQITGSALGSTKETTPSIRIIMIGNASTNKLVNRICLSLSLYAHGEQDTDLEFTFSNAIVYEKKNFTERSDLKMDK